MDDSSQNDLGIQQKPTVETTSNYPPYPDPSLAAKPPKHRNPIILAAIGLLLLLILISAVLVVQNKLNHRTVACADEKCLNQRFSKCLPATYIDNSSDSSAKYTITGNQDIGCIVNVVYIKAKNSSGLAGKSMTCDFDNRVDFRKAAQNVFYFPDDYSCKGSLVDVFKSLNNVTGGS